MQTIVKPSEKLTKPTPQNRPKQTNKYIKDSVWVNKELQSMIDQLAAQQQIISKVQLFDTKQYSRHQFNKWQEKYSGIPSIQERLKKIEEMLESHLITAGMTRNPAFPIFLLKNHYGYQDKREVTTDNNYSFTVSRGLPLPVRKQVQAKVTKTSK